MMNNTKKIVAIFLLVFIVGAISGIVGYSNAKKTQNQERAVEIATAHLSYPTTVIEAKELECDGCFSIILQRDDNQQQFTITLDNWKIAH